MNCLARWPQTLQIQTIPLDERNWIGVVDLKLCLQAVAQGSPELVGQQEHDYTVYASDYSEPDIPLVGQGMLSWGLEPQSSSDEQKLITGRVTKNLLAVFGNGVKETLEVKLKLTAVAKMQRTESPMDTQQGLAKNAPTPTDTTEWNSFIQANPTLGRSASIAVAPIRQDMQGTFLMDARPSSRPSSVPPILPALPKLQPAPGPSQLQPTEDSANTLTAVANSVPREAAPRPSRPSSRASRSRATGRPRGRPRKNALPDGNTSAAEEHATDADDGPKKKRAKTTKAEYPIKTPLDAAPESLRVAASTSGSLRTMRPILPNPDANPASHLQEAPRAPTPVPQGMQAGQQLRKTLASKPRRESLASFDGSSYRNTYQDSQMQLSQQQDARSPTESIAPSPDNYTPEDSPADLGSSPPVPRSTAYMQSSPAPSSPILPPMPKQQPDSGFMSGGVDDFFDEEEFLQTLPQQAAQEEPPAQAPQPPKPISRRGSSRQHDGFSFKAENPGPRELLPATSIYNPPNQKSLNASSKPLQLAPQLKRANTEPNRRESIPNNLQDQQDMGPAATQPDASTTITDEAERAELKAEPPSVQETLDPGDLESSVDLIKMLEESRQLEESNEELPVTITPPEPPPLDVPQPPQPAQAPKPRHMARAVSMSAAIPTVPASDPAPVPTLALPPPPPPPPTAFSEAPCPPSDAAEMQKFNKNFVKKQSIKEKLEKAVLSGEMPPFCNNCGAIETPTWRKMWTQDHDGVPEYFEYSEKPGQVTAIDILERDSEGKPAKYRLVKKALGPLEDKGKWKEMLLCNRKAIW